MRTAEVIARVYDPTPMSSVTGEPTREESEHLAAARRGDEAAFQALVEPRRSELHVHCYRMLGSVDDAEDALQEALIRAWRGLPRFEGRSSLRSWLYRIATNSCLNMLRSRPTRVLPVDFGPAADPHEGRFEPHTESVWIDPYPDVDVDYEQRETVELAFIAALQHLPANQRAVLILREVLGFSAREVADALDTSVQAVNSALQRARKQVDERLPDESQQAALATLGDERLKEVVEQYAKALEEGDVDTILGLVASDATWSMPPTPVWYRGRDELAVFLAKGPSEVRWRHLHTTANGQPAVAGYVEEDGVYRAFAFDVLSFRDGRIQDVTAFLDGAIFPRFGLPAELPGG